MAPGRGVAGKTGIGSHHFHALAGHGGVHCLLDLHDGAGALQAAGVDAHHGAVAHARRIFSLSVRRRRLAGTETCLGGQNGRYGRGIGLVAANQVAHVGVAVPHQDALRQIAAQTHGAKHHDGTVRRHFRQALAQVVEGNVHGARDGAEGKFLGRAGVDEHKAVFLRRQLAPGDGGHGSAQQVGGHIAGDGDGVLGRREGRRVGVFGLHEVVHRSAVLDELGNLVDALVHALVTHALGAVEAARPGVEGQLQRQGQGVGIVAGVRAGVGHGAQVVHAQLLQALGGQAGGGHGEVEHLGDGGADGALVGGNVAQGHVVGHDASLSVGRAGQIVQPGLARQRVRELDGVAHGIDVGGRGLQVLVHPDAARLAQLQSGLLGQGRGGTHADGEQHEVGLQGLAALQEDGEGLVGAAEAGDALLQVEAHALLHEVLVHGGGHGVVDGGHHLISHLDHRDGHAGVVQVFGHLQPDEARAHHHGTAHALLREVSLDAVGVVHIAQGEDALLADALEGRTHGRGAGREEQLVVGLLVGGAVGTAHGYGLAGGVDGHGLVLHAHVDAEALPERLGRLHQQLGTIFDDAADVVRQAAVGVRDVGSLLQQDDVCRFVHSSQSGGGGCSACHAPNNQVFHNVSCGWIFVVVFGFTPQRKV